MNRLSRETSPYLKQHQDNPVDWYPWGAEALEKAKREDKPILLSVGYSACHWCHVMAHESFESEPTARLMNELFVSVKVDREERPDLDQIYQNVAQLFTQGGGWPLTVFLTPELKPFFGGTYFPPEDRYGRPGFPRVLKAISDAYRNDRGSVAENADKVMAAIAKLETFELQGDGSSEAARHTWAGLGEAAKRLLSAVDWHNGGLGAAPKFPNPMTFSFLWRLAQSERESTLPLANELREAVVLTLTRMAEGGIYDQLGGGFSRYSVDEHWAVPHFEKMLYDNGLLLKLYSEVLLTAGDWLSPESRELFERVVRETVDYVLREMTAPEGGFYAAQDADSEGEEGKFFVWKPSELREFLSSDEARLFERRYGLTEAGNFEHGATVLFAARSVGELAAEEGMDVKELGTRLKSIRQKAFEVRERRVRPGLDNKILASWNGLMISGLAWASQAIGSRRALEAAERAFAFVTAKMEREDGRLHSVFHRDDGQAKLNGYLDDYAFMAQAGVDLARFSEDPAPKLEASARWTRRVLGHFKDPDPSALGYFFTSDDHEELIQRPKTIQDQAIPAGTAVVLQCLAALSEMGLPDAETAAVFEVELKKQISPLVSAAVARPHGSAELLSAGLLDLLGSIVVSGPADSVRLAAEAFVFRKDGAGHYLVCHTKTCGTPANSLNEARSQIKEIRRPALRRGSEPSDRF